MNRIHLNVRIGLLAGILCCFMGCTPHYRPVSLVGVRCKNECSRSLMGCATYNSAACLRGLDECYESCGEMEKLEGAK